MTDQVSIITANYNGERFLAQCIDSVFNQSYSNWELIIVDDASSDRSQQVISEYANQDSRIKPLFLTENIGAAAARNQAIAKAQGRYLAILDSDDYWHPDKLKKQLDFMNHHQVAFCSTSYSRIDETGTLIGQRNVPELGRFSYRDLLKRNQVGCLTVMIDRKRAGELRFPLIKMRNDYGLWLELTRKGLELVTMKDVLAYYRVHAGSLTGNKLRAAKYQWKLLREVEKLGVWSCLKYYAHYLAGNISSRIAERLSNLLAGVAKKS